MNDGLATSRRWRSISPNRRLVLDGLRFACRVPLYPVEMVVELSDLAELRDSAPRHISWASIFVKAYGLVAARHPQLRQAYVRWPWPHLVEELHSTAMVVVNRQHLGEDRICWGRITRPESLPLVELQQQLDAYRTRPVERVFAGQLRLARFPAPLRRLLLWLNMNFGGSKRAKRLGTFTMSTLAGQGVLNRAHQTFLTSSLTYGPLDEEGRCVVTLLCDHRVVDGVVAARALNDLQATLAREITAELRSIRDSRTAAA